MELSSLDNCGLSGLSTMRREDAATFVRTTKSKPGEPAFDDVDGFAQYRTLLPVVAGQLWFYAPSPYTRYVIYCGVEDGDTFKWVPVQMYGNVSNTLGNV